MKTPLYLEDIRAVVFDVFGTVAKIGAKRSPFVKLLREFANAGRTHLPGDVAKIMTNQVDLAGAIKLFQCEISAGKLEALEHELIEELGSIVLFPDAIPTITSLRAAGFKIALCSNLAAPYAAPISSLLPFSLDAYAWSFEIGSLKPDPTIYTHLCEELRLAPSEVLMIGDSVIADYEGPRSVGMSSVHLTRDSRSKVLDSVQALGEIFGGPKVQPCEYLDRACAIRK